MISTLGFFKSILGSWAKNSPARILIFKAAWQQKKRLFVVLILSLVSALLEGLTFGLLAIALEIMAINSPLDNKYIKVWGFNWLAEWSREGQFVLVILTMVLFQIIKSIVQVISNQNTTILSAKAAQEVQKKVLNIILDFPFGTASKYKVGELASFVIQPAGSIAETLVQTVSWFASFLTVIAYVVLLCSISLNLFLASTVLFSFVIILQKQFSKKIGKLAKKMAIEQAELTRRVVEGVSSLRIIHSFQRHNLLNEQISGLQNKFINTMRDLQGRLALLAPVADSILLIGLGGFLLFGFFSFKDKSDTFISELLTFVAVMNRLSGKISTLGSGFSNIKQFAGRVGVLNEILEEWKYQKKENRSEILSNFLKGIRFENVGLQYPGRDEWAIKCFSVEIKKGSKVALVGSSGSGKSTIADLLLCLYAPTVGRILIDGIDLTSIELSSWRDHLGIVNQDTQLFNASIKENLIFARPSATDEDIKQALKDANAFEFVESMPNGVNTLIGERGFMLSGGQRQRLAIARALLRKPSILILDEATSALDSLSEKIVQETIDKVDSSCTQLIIAHRLSTIKQVDNIIVMDKGVVVEFGKHSELVDKKGLYFSLWDKQTSN